MPCYFKSTLFFMVLSVLMLNLMKCIHKKKEELYLLGEMKHLSAEKASVRDLCLQERTLMFSEVDTLPHPMCPPGK